MANPAQLARQAAQAKWPGASVHARGRNWIRHAHPTEPGRFMLDASIGPLHYGPGDDQEIDTAWQPTTGAWQYEMTLNDWQTYARDTFNVGGLFQFEAQGQSLQFDPQSINWIDENTSRQQIAIKQAVTAAVDDDTLTFAGAYGGGIDFSYTNQTARLQKLITIDQFSRLPAPTVQGQQVWFEAEFSMALSAGIEFWIDGAKWTRSNGVRVQTVNMIEVRDTAGTNVLWWLGAPRVWDSSAEGNEAVGQLEVRRQGGPSSLFITVRVPYSWMSAATYPVYIDPTIDAQVAASADDADESSGTVTTNAASVLINTTSTYLGCRWSLTADQGVTVDAAYASYYNISPNRPVDYVLRVQDADTAAAFTTATNDISGRTAHATTVNWDNGSATVATNTWVDTASLVTPVQGVIDRAGWSSGNYLCVYFNERSGGAGGLNVRTYDGSTTEAPKFHLEYTAGGPTYTLTAAAGSLTLTGRAAGLKAARKLSAAAGSLTLTGNAATLTYSGAPTTYSLTAATGSLTLTGNPVYFALDEPGSADWGTYRRAFAPGTSSDWDEVFWGGASGRPIKVGGTWYFYYCGSQNQFGNGDEYRSIGLATSTDCHTWTKHASNPLVTYTTTANAEYEEGASNPVVMEESGTWHMWYAASRYNGTPGQVDIDIRYRTSTDGVTWTGDTLVYSVANEEYIPIGVMKNGSTYYLYILGNLAGGAGPLSYLSGTTPSSLGGKTSVSATSYKGSHGMNDLTPYTVSIALRLASNNNYSWHRIDKATPATLGAQLDTYAQETGHLLFYILKDGDVWREISPEFGAGLPNNQWFMYREYSRAAYLQTESGSLTLSGQAAALTVARKLSAANGSLSLTGQAAALKVDRKLVAASGTLTLTGQATGLAAARKLAADAGSLTLTGQAVALVAGRKLTAGAGTLTLAGQAATLKTDRNLTAAGGSLTLTGQAAALVAARTLAAGNGSLTLTGQAALLKVARQMVAASGSLTLTGQDATLTYTPVGGPTYTLTAASGSLTLTGQAAGLIVARKLVATSGTLVLTGQAAALSVARQLAAGNGSLTLAGQAALLTRALVLVALSGSLTLTGNAATLTYSGIEEIRLSQMVNLRLRTSATVNTRTRGSTTVNTRTRGSTTVEI